MNIKTSIFEILKTLLSDTKRKIDSVENCDMNYS